MALSDLLSRKLVIVTGKGGVGKTTVTAAIARAAASKGKRVLCAEIVPHPDTPSQLNEALGGAAPSEEPTRADEGIDVVLLTPTMGHRRFLQDTLPLKVLADAAMKSAGLKKFLMAAPGFSEMGVMYRAVDLMRRERWDLMLLDAPATGHSLALAQIPAFLMKVIPKGPIGRIAKQGLEVLTDPKVTSSIVVTLPETLPVTEALELAKGLERHRVPVGVVVVNRVPADPFSADERAAVKQLVTNGHGVFGGRELERIERSDAALQLLKQHADRKVVEVSELDLKGPALAKELAQRMVTG